MSLIIEQLKKYIASCQEAYVTDKRTTQYVRQTDMEALERKRQTLAKRKAEIVKNIVDGKIISEQTYQDRTIVDYLLTIQNLIRHKGNIYMEEQLQRRRAVIEDGEVIDDYLVSCDGDEKAIHSLINTLNNHRTTRSSPDYVYDRLAVVKYAERWWNDYNPHYRSFENDCTNFISQCVKAGGAPMSGNPDRSNGWWYTGELWSYSWAVAHALRWYLSGAKSGLQATEVQSAEDLMIGDVICYDFDGDGRWQHTTIVTGKDGEGQPLVNAHTANSRMRYWAYEDSTAWTPKIKYKFFHILDRNS